MKKRTPRTRKRAKATPRRKRPAKTGLSHTRVEILPAAPPIAPPRDTSNARPTIDPLTGDLPAVTLANFQEVLSHFERVDPRLAEAWRRDVAVHSGPITLRRILLPGSFGGATHYAYVDRRLLWYLKRDGSDPVGARWEGYLIDAGDAPPNTIAVVSGRNLRVMKRDPQLAEKTQQKRLNKGPSLEIQATRDHPHESDE